MSKYLRRYTHLPALLYMLRERKITLLSPATWDDGNDSHYLLQYKERKNLKAVLALCFSQSEETYHHWRIFSGNAAGVCVRFERDELCNALLQQPGVQVKDVEYLRLRDAKSRRIRLEELPFLKRAAFSAEDEIRALFESERKVLQSLDIPIPLSCIKRITLSPWLPKVLSPATKAAIRAVDGCDRLDIRTSTLVGNEEWKLLAENAT